MAPPAAAEPAGDRPIGDMPAGDIPAGDIPAGDMPAGERRSGGGPAEETSPPDPPREEPVLAVPPGGAPSGAESSGGEAPVLIRQVVVTNRRGLHARAAARFVSLAERFGAAVDVLRDGQTVSARSIMGLMMLGAGQGASLELRAEGWDAKEALEALAELIEAGFHEQD